MTEYLLGKGSITIGGKPVAEVKDMRLHRPRKASTAKNRVSRPGPNAVFRHFAMNGASMGMLLDFLDWRARMQTRALFQGLAQVKQAVQHNTRQVLELGQSAGKTTVAVEQFGAALDSLKKD